MDVSAQLHALASLPLKEKKRRLSGPKGLFGRLEEEKNPFASVKNGNVIPRLPGHSLVTLPNELSGLSHRNREFVSIINDV